MMEKELMEGCQNYVERVLMDRGGPAESGK